MSDDEFAMLIIHGVVGLGVWAYWLFTVLTPRHLGRGTAARWVVCQAPLVAIIALASLFEAFAASDVQGTFYVWWYVVMGAAWVGVGGVIFAKMGIHPRDDVGERRNAAAAWAIVGASLGLALAFAGSNFGDGPGWWVVAFCSALSMGALLLLWGAVAAFSHAAESITVERDTGSGVRAGLFLVACGAILGRSAAGDWTGYGDAALDILRVGWPVIPLAAFEVAFAELVRPRPRGIPIPAPILLRGLLPGALYLALAGAYIVLVGWW